MNAALRDIPTDRIVLRHLKSTVEINAVRSLRAHIGLSHHRVDPDFASREKKETNWA